MKTITDSNNKKLILTIMAILTAVLLFSQLLLRILFGSFSLLMAALGLTAIAAVTVVCLRYFDGQNKRMEMAVSQIDSYLAGNKDVRIDCDDEGEMNKLFHAVNRLAAVLNAHAQKELRAKVFLKDTISDISHQLKTPLAALSIYNGLLQGEMEGLLKETEGIPDMQEFVSLSEKELDRMDMLVQNLLKITRLDAGSIVFEKRQEDLSEMMQDIALHFSYRAKEEHKELRLYGEEETLFFCDRDWLMEALENIIKNAFDHTGSGGVISVTWKQSASVVQITVRDNGSGIHPEDIFHIFKRFYRSRFSSDRQGIGLGLPLAKAIIEAHGGTIEVDSRVGEGTAFVMDFLV